MNNTTKSFMVFNNKKIEIKTPLISEYENKVGPFTDKTISYLIATLGLDESYSTKELEREIEAAMVEDCNESSLVKEIISDEVKREELFDARYTERECKHIDRLS